MADVWGAGSESLEMQYRIKCLTLDEEGAPYIKSGRLT